MTPGHRDAQGAAKGSPFVLAGVFAQSTLLVLDSITEALQHPGGVVLVTGSHGGVSAGRFALQVRPRLVVFNDAGVGKDGAGTAALALLQAAGIAACTVAHTSARIGEANSTLQHGVLSFVNDAAAALGLRAGQRLAQALSAGSAESSPGRR
jgi:hypothetical protein